MAVKILISTTENPESEFISESSELNYDSENKNFWMSLVMGDDWFQRTTSTLSFEPTLVKRVDDCYFIVCDLLKEAEELNIWLQEANQAVRDGYATMRG